MKISVKRLSGYGIFLVLMVTVSVITGISCSNKGEQLCRENEAVNTVNRLFIYTDRMDWKGVMGCFADEVNFDMTSMTGGKPVKMTPQQIADGWEKGLKGITAVHHQAGNYIVTLNRKSADVFCYAVAFHYLPNPSGRNVRIFVGSYNFHLVESGNSWKIDSFRFNLKFVEGNKNLQKSAR